MKKLKKIYGWKFKPEWIGKENEVMFNSIPLEKEQQFIHFSKISQNAGALVQGIKEKDVALSNIIGFFINYGIFLRDNDLIEVNRKKPEEEAKLDENKTFYLG